MRLALVSLIAVASAAAPAFAQMVSPSGSPSQPMPMPMGSPPAPAASAPPAATPATSAPAESQAAPHRRPPPPHPPIRRRSRFSTLCKLSVSLRPTAEILPSWPRLQASRRTRTVSYSSDPATSSRSCPPAPTPISATSTLSIRSTPTPPASPLWRRFTTGRCSATVGRFIGTTRAFRAIRSSRPARGSTTVGQNTRRS